jgi:hypothetical protein
MLRLIERPTSATSSKPATTSSARHVRAGRAIASAQRMSETSAAHLTNGVPCRSGAGSPGGQSRGGTVGSTCELCYTARAFQRGFGSQAARGSLRWSPARPACFHRMSVVWGGCTLGRRIPVPDERVGGRAGYECSRRAPAGSTGCLKHVRAVQAAGRAGDAAPRARRAANSGGEPAPRPVAPRSGDHARDLLLHGVVGVGPVDLREPPVAVTAALDLRHLDRRPAQVVDHLGPGRVVVVALVERPAVVEALQGALRGSPHAPEAGLCIGSGGVHAWQGAAAVRRARCRA